MSGIYNYNFDEPAYLRDHRSLSDSLEEGSSAYRHLIVNGTDEELSHYTVSAPEATVTIVVPCFRAVDFLEHTLESIRDQTFKSWECICVDDFSQDGTIELIKRFTRADRRFKLIPHRANGGVNAARNTGIRSARGRFTCFLDSDDLLMPRSIANRVRALTATDSHRLGGSYSASMRISEDCTQAPAQTEAPNMRMIDFITTAGMCPFNANQPMFKTAVLRQLGGFDESMRQAEDWEFWLRILRHGYYMVPTYTTDVTYRERLMSVVRSAPLRHLEKSLEVYEAAHCRLPANKIYEGAPFVYSKPWVSYKRQLDISRRVFEFCGMALTNGGVNGRAVELSARALPDFFQAINSHRDPAVGLRAGVRRQMVGSGDEASRFTAQPLVSEYIESWSQTRPRNPATDPSDEYPPSLGRDVAAQRDVDVVFLPHKDYQVWSFALILDALRDAGISYTFVDLTVIYRDERARAKLDELGLPRVSYNELVLGNFRPKLVVCMNDWDPIVRGIVKSCQALGIPTVGIVEGVQDYLDVDTGRVRSPYRTVDYVLLPGEFDRRYFADVADAQRVRVGGVPRIDELLAEDNAFPERPLVVINSNFTYNVLTDQRDDWVRSAVEACEQLGYDYLISRHPADRGDFSAYNVADESMYDLIRRGSVFVSRFGSGILESLAMGKPAIYYNPHGENIDKFTEPNGAFPISTSKDQLVDQLRETVENPQQFLAHAADYVELHCGARAGSDTSAVQRVGAELVSIYNTATIPGEDMRKRLKYLLLDDAERALGDEPREAFRRTVGDGVSERLSSVGRGLTSVSGNAAVQRLQTFGRKARKFGRNPRAFFTDSRKGPLRKLGKLFNKG